ncbi:MAG: ABC transporter ATP-binding protein [Betaproteobacteria bacterium]|nr:ABC transporter ATP-binding protein [Betaproteobacteria bacterium]
MLRVDAICSGYSEIQVLTDLSLRVERGEIVAIVGANGAGKSTLLRTIMGALPARSGSVTFLGEPLTGVSPHRIAAGGLRLVPEGRRVFASLSVEENLRAGAYLLSRAAAASAIERVFALFPNLAERRTQLASTLSGGQQQMLALGRALAAEPKMLMLDEPSLGLAPKIVEEIFQKLEDLRSAENGILLVEQNARKALALADRAYVLENGRVVLEGAAADLFRNESVVNAYLGGEA